MVRQRWRNSGVEKRGWAASSLRRASAHHGVAGSPLSMWRRISSFLTARWKTSLCGEGLEPFERLGGRSEPRRQRGQPDILLLQRLKRV